MKDSFVSLLVFNIFLFCIFTGNIYSEEDTFLKDTLSLDIDTSNYYDLVIWVNKLGLESTGSIEEIRGKLYTYYDIKPNVEIITEESVRTIIIESARELNYINDISIDQNYVILKGEVLLEMIDPDNNTSHKIKADKIIFNQSEKTISAYGNIEYEIISESDTEYFHGESLVFEIESWEGIFFEGVSENIREIEYEELSTVEDVPFFFSGDYIYRSSTDRIILNKGTITSSESDEPYYRIDAEKIWVLRPGEWAIKNAVLYVGRIPVFYFPAFFLPGDDLFFDPAFGVKEISGYFINTTTYLIGIKDKEDNDTFSFLKSNDDTPEEKIRKGLFLTTGKKKLDTESLRYLNDSSLKLMVDYYSRKGFFLGIDGSLKFDSSFKSLNIFTAISLSRYLYKYTSSNNYVYTHLIKDESGQYNSIYEESYLFGQVLPFRYAFDVSMDISNSWVTMNLDIPLYSDTKFRTHFMNREEGLKWTEFFKNKDDDEEEEPENQEKEITYLNWIINGSFTPSFEILSPAIENISLDKIDIKLRWHSSVLNYPHSDLLVQNSFELVDSLSYYYPVTLTLPDISGNISGTIFESSNGSTEKTNEQLELEEFKSLLDPWTIENINFPGVETDLIIDPEKLDYFPLEISSESKIFSNKLKYSISPSLLVNSIFSSELPETPEEISFKTDYSVLTTQTTSLLDYSFNLYDSFLTFSSISNYSMNYKQHYDPSGIIEKWDSYLIQDKKATNNKVTDNIIVVSKPFTNSKVLSESSITYNLNTTIYNRYYEDSSEKFIQDYFVWDDESISIHKAVIELKFFDSINYQILKLKMTIPPINPELYPEIILSSDHLTGSLKTGFKYIEELPENYWQFEPYEGYIKYSFFENDYLKQTVSIDFEESINNFGRTELYVEKMDTNIELTQIIEVDLYESKPTKSSTDLNLWFLSFNYLSEDIKGYSFVSPFGWIQDSDSKFQPSKASAGVNYKYYPDPFWKNRIKFALDINSSWTMNLQKYTDTAAYFGVKLSLDIAEFVELTFESKSVNNKTFRYIPGYTDELGLANLNILYDLIRSFNFFNENDRVSSNFNIESVSLSAIHHLSDWDLHVEYSGQPVLITNSDNSKEYQLESELSIFVIWRPVPEIEKKMIYSDDEINF